MHCRVQARVTLASATGISKQVSLTPAERELVELIPADGDGLAVESLCEGRDRTSVLRAVRRLEAKGVVEREWRLISPSGKPRVLQGVRIANVAEDGDGLPAKQAEVMKVMRELGRDVSLIELSTRFDLSGGAISALRKKGILESVKIITRRGSCVFQCRQRACNAHKPAAGRGRCDHGVDRIRRLPGVSDPRRDRERQDRSLYALHRSRAVDRQDQPRAPA